MTEQLFVGPFSFSASRFCDVIRENAVAVKTLHIMFGLNLALLNHKMTQRYRTPFSPHE
jgi:hypothetical protein